MNVSQVLLVFICTVAGTCSTTTNQWWGHKVIHTSVLRCPWGGVIPWRHELADVGQAEEELQLVSVRLLLLRDWDIQEGWDSWLSESHLVRLLQLGKAVGAAKMGHQTQMGQKPNSILLSNSALAHPQASPLFLVSAIHLALLTGLAECLDRCQHFPVHQSPSVKIRL